MAVEWTLPNANESDALSDRLKRVFDVLVKGSGYAEEHDIDPGITDDQVPLINGLKEAAAKRKKQQRRRKKAAS